MDFREDFHDHFRDDFFPIELGPRCPYRVFNRQAGRLPRKIDFAGSAGEVDFACQHGDNSNENKNQLSAGEAEIADLQGTARISRFGSLFSLLFSVLQSHKRINVV